MRNQPENGAKNFCSWMSWRRCTVLRVAEGVDVGLVQIPLIQIARVAEEPEIDLALVAVEEQEADVRNVRRAAWASSSPASTAARCANSALQPSDTQTLVWS